MGGGGRGTYLSNIPIEAIKKKDIYQSNKYCFHKVQEEDGGDFKMHAQNTHINTGIFDIHL